VADLAEHLANVYWHKVFVLRTGVRPEGDEFLPPLTYADSPQVYLDGAFNVLSAALDSEPAGNRPVWTFDPRSQSVEFWFRRMAHETMIHRFDAELASHERTSFDPDLALDGVDEILSWVPFLTDDAAPKTPIEMAFITAVTKQRAVHYQLTLTHESSNAAVVQSRPQQCEAWIEGPAEDVNLLLWGRMPATNPRLIVGGEKSHELLASLRPLGD
jgi:uncharacterized protein (TIGR03083 family)